MHRAAESKGFSETGLPPYGVRYAGSPLHLLLPANRKILKVLAATSDNSYCLGYRRWHYDRETLVEGELASVRGVVDLSPEAALDEAEAFLTRLGYISVQRTDTSLVAERRQPDRAEGQKAPSLTVRAVPQMGGGVGIRVRGTDREGMQEQQAAWVEWSENLPKKTKAQTTPPADQQPDAQTRVPFKTRLSALKSAARELLRSHASPAVSRWLPANPLIRDILLGALLALCVAVLLMVVTYAILALRGVFSNPSAPLTLGLVVFALLHGGAASVTVPPIPSLFGLGGAADLGLPVSSFALLPFIVLLVSSRYVARQAQTAGIFALATAFSYTIIVGLFAALGNASVATAEGVEIEFAADPISTAIGAFLWAGLGAMFGAAVAHGPLLPARVRQVVRGSLVAIGISVGLTLLLAAIAMAVTLLLGDDGPGQPPTDLPPLNSESASTGETLALLDDVLAFLGALIALLPWILGSLWLLAHGVPVGFQDASSLTQLPLVGPALADAPLRVSLLGTWPWGATWRLLLLAPIGGLIVGGRLATRGAPRTDRWWQGALVAVPYTLIAVLVAFLTRLTADLTLAGATLSITLGASLPWVLLLLPVSGALGALGGYIAKDGGEVAPARPRLTFLLTGIISATILLLSLPGLMVSGSSANQDLVGSSIPDTDFPLEPPPPEATSTQGEIASPARKNPDLKTPSRKSRSSPSKQPDAGGQPVGIGEPVTVGDMEWIVNSTRREARIRAQSREVLQGDFIIVNFDITNNSDEQMQLNPSSLGLVGSQGRRFEVLPDMSRYVPPDRDPFSQSINPGDTLEGRAVFDVEPEASGFQLQLGDGRRLPQENGYVDLGS